jgi:glycine/D-amino acid oxidase-like deaminating enzyme
MIGVVGSERGGFLRASSSSTSRASSSFFPALETGRYSPKEEKRKKRKKSGRRIPNNNNCFHGGDKNEAGEKIKNVAIIGAGFAGLSCAYNLIKCSSNSSDSNGAGVRVTVFASERAGRGGASSVAAGLLHRRTPKGSKMPFGSLGYAKTVEMLEKCQKIEEMMVDPDLNLSSGIDFRFSGELRDVKRGKMFRKVGCLRPARTEKDTIGIKKNVLLKNTKNDDNNNSDDKRLMLEEEEEIEDAIRFVERDEIEVDLLRLRNKGEEVGDKDKDVNNSCGFYVENGIVVDAQRYLEALKVLIEFEAAKNADANVSFAFKKRRVESLEDVAKESFDAVILCCGGEILRDGFLDDSTKQELLEKVGGPLELQAGRALVLERENCFVREEGGEKWEMPGILGSHYLSPFQTTKAMFGPTKERGDKVKAEDAAKAGYYSTEAAKASFPDTPETIDFLLRELNEKVYPRANAETKENQTNIFFSTKDIDTVAYGVRVNGPRTHAGRFPKIIQFDEKKKKKKTNNDSRKIFAVTAVGARGLLYHALLGEWVARTVLFASSSSSSAASSSSSSSSKDDRATTFETIVPAEFR